MQYCYHATAKLPTQWGEFQIHTFEDLSQHQEHLAVTFGNILQAENPIIRVHSECLTGDALFSERCDCGPQLRAAMERISSEGCGMVLYLRQEGRGIGLMNKIRAYELQDQGMDTVEANLALGFPADNRDYGICQFMLNHFGITHVRVLTNNPRKVAALEAVGITVSERLPHQIKPNRHNQAYLGVKATKLGHFLNPEADPDNP